MAAWLTHVTVMNVALLALVLLGLIVRGKARRLRSLVAYVALTLGAAGAAILWPERFHIWSFWLAKEGAVRLLGVALLIELGLSVFARMPTARRVALRSMAGVGVATLGTLACVRAPGAAAGAGADPFLLTIAVDVLPRLAFASAVLAVLLLAVMWHYCVPLDPLHRGVIYGFAPYLVLYALTIGSMSNAAQHATANLATVVAYLLMLTLWALAVWRRDPEPPVAPSVVHWLQPWR